MIETNLAIDAAVRYQKINYFGASAAWWAQGMKNWNPETRDRILDYLFDKEKGIGLTVIRYNLGGGKEHSIINDQLRKAACIEVAPGVFDWTKDFEAIEIVNGAVARGASVILFSNSPPERLTITGAATGNGSESNLQNGKEREFASYLVNAAEYLTKELKWPITDISPINEPQWNWGAANGQEGSHWTPDQAYSVVKSLNEEIKSRNLSYSISAVDSAEMKIATNYQYINKLFEDEELRKSLSHYAVHSYWSSLDDREAIASYMQKKYPEIELWMTEWTEMQSGKDTGMDSALMLATTVYQDFVYGGVSSWQYWIAMSPYNYRDGLMYVDFPTKTFELTKRLFTLGNWSKFIDYGATRIKTEIESSSKVQVSGFLNTDDSLVLVFVNMTKTEYNNIACTGLSARYGDLSIYETSDVHNLEMVYNGGVKNIEVPPRSVVTAVIKK